jgi:hypothetical protein
MVDGRKYKIGDLVYARKELKDESWYHDQEMEIISYSKSGFHYAIMLSSPNEDLYLYKAHYMEDQLISLHERRKEKINSIL